MQVQVIRSQKGLGGDITGLCGSGGINGKSRAANNIGNDAH
jgi:hypothetical protein